MFDTIKGKPPLDLYQAVREIACRLDEVIDYLNHNNPNFSDVYVRTFNGKTGDVVGVSSVNGQTGDVEISAGGAVDSVNGKTGDVTLTGDDISLNPLDDQSISTAIDTLYGPDNVPPYPVTSVNGQTGDVEISTGGGSVDSVNGKTGAVLLTASDINATEGGTVQQNIDSFSSNIEELGNEVDGKYSSTNPPPYPVTRVNNLTGEVWISYLTQKGVIISTSENSEAPGVTFFEDNAWGRNGICVKYSSQVGGFPVLEQSYKPENTNNFTPIYTAANPPPYPVISVNNKTGAITGLYDAENQPPYPVTSVNGLTGDVTIPTYAKFVYPPPSEKVSEYSVDVPANCMLTIMSALQPFTSDTTTLPVGNEDGLTLIRSGVGLDMGHMVTQFKLTGYSNWRIVFISNSTCVVRYKNVDTSPINVHYGANLQLFNPSNEGFTLTIMATY